MRRVPKYDQKKDGGGKKLCLVCNGAIPPRRSSYCSNECYIRNTPQIIRRRVETRDKGICASCGVQCQWRDHPLRYSDRKAFWMLPKWEADHIVPVAEGGGLCGVDGYRTLCKKCHGIESGKLYRRLNEKKRPSLFTVMEVQS
jgi:5-methylcytosine-specific restriction protein A